ncbi:glycoside hydrolase family 78 protein [Flavobacterium undicola]|uniref:glycoside hydrolase family 78 protein n=1 Tax=Flavobacterium undicola TaxID=1932779 RepID=UPI0013783B17|nr:hypothetical protein [Flavobacterium undicola]MBA0882701.1 hypothetical protein [Flavobacterium undicola]
MRKIIYSLFIGFLLLSCSGNDSSPTPEPQNTAPSVPALVSPANATLCIDNVVSLEWGASTDAENNPISYQIQIATDNQFTQVVKTAEGAAIGQTITLNKGTAYYWRVKATDNKNASSNYSATYSFYTEAVAVANYLPFLPQLVQPEINSFINPATAILKWTATDVDTNNVLTYDVYLGTANPPIAKVGDNLASTSLGVNPLQAATNYYWRVVVKDNKGGETIGQVWYFKTN